MLAQYPNRARYLPAHGAAMSAKLAAQRYGLTRPAMSQVQTPTRSMYRPTMSTAQPATMSTQQRPAIPGWSNYTGRTMGEVGQYSRIPGFGRQFRG